jgi:hypothetical protein
MGTPKREAEGTCVGRTSTPSGMFGEGEMEAFGNAETEHVVFYESKQRARDRTNLVESKRK